MADDNTRLNPNLVVTAYFDSLVSLVNAHADQQLAVYSSSDVLETPGNEFEQEIEISRPNDNDLHGVLSYWNPYRGQYEYSIRPSSRFVSGTTRVREFLSSVRNEMVERLNQARLDACRQLEIIKIDVNETNTEDKLLERVFSRRFPIVIRIDKFDCDFDGSRYSITQNSSPFRLYLIELDFYLNQQQMEIFR